MDKCINGIIPTDISDHFSIFHILLSDACPEKSQPKVCRRIYNDSNLVKFANALETVDWSDVYASSDPNTAYSKLHNIFNDTLEHCIPLQELKVKRRPSKPWLTNDLLDDIAMKNDMYKRLKIDGDISLLESYKLFKNKLTNALRKEEKNYY